MRYGRHGAERLFRVLSGGLDRQTGGIDTCICRNRMEYWSSHASGLPDSPRGAGYVSDGDGFELDCQAALQPARTAAAHASGRSIWRRGTNRADWHHEGRRKAVRQAVLAKKRAHKMSSSITKLNAVKARLESLNPDDIKDIDNAPPLLERFRRGMKTTPMVTDRAHEVK